MLIIDSLDLAYVEFPRTGTSYLRRVLRDFNLEHTQPSPSKPGCPRHSPASFYDVASIKTLAVTVRNPTSWVESFWRYHRGMSLLAFQPSLFYAHKRLFPVGEDFETWLSKLLDADPECISSIYSQMTDGCNHLVPFESYESHLAVLLGLDEARLRRTAIDNVSRKHVCVWTSYLDDRFTECAKEASSIWEGAR